MTDATIISYGGGPFVHRAPRLGASPLEEIYTRQASWITLEGVTYRLAGKGQFEAESPSTWITTATMFGANYLPQRGEVYENDVSVKRSVQKLNLGVLLIDDSPCRNFVRYLKRDLVYELGAISSRPQGLTADCISGDAKKLMDELNCDLAERCKNPRNNGNNHPAIFRTEMFLFIAESTM